MTALVRVAAPAKVNLFLGVGPVRADGYHPLATVYQAVGVYDELGAERAVDGRSSVSVRGSVDTAGVPTGPDNLALRAVQLLAAHHGRELAVALHLDKRIPVAGGLAGGSADAAAALVAVDELHALHTPRAVLLELAGRLGSDVPFCLIGGTAMGSGRGELVEAVPTGGEFWWVVVPDAAGLSTPAVYAEFDRLHGDGAPPDPVVPPALLEALRTGDARLLGPALRNDLQPAALSLRPDLADVLSAGLAGGAGVSGALGALVSGSGPTTVFLGSDADHAHGLAHCLQQALGRSHASAPFVVPAPVPGARQVQRLAREHGGRRR